MSTFRVTTSDLQALASTLGSLVGELQQSAAGVSPGIAGAAGNGALAGSIEGFLNDWTAGLQTTSTRLEELGQRLGGAAASYEETETGIAGGFGG